MRYNNLRNYCSKDLSAKAINGLFDRVEECYSNRDYIRARELLREVIIREELSLAFDYALGPRIEGLEKMLDNNKGSSTNNGCGLKLVK